MDNLKKRYMDDQIFVSFLFRPTNCDVWLFIISRVLIELPYQIESA